MVRTTVLHEMSHCMGLDHTDGTSGRIMSPGYRPAIAHDATLTAGEKDVLRRLGAGQTLPITNCRVTCATNASYDAATAQCRCNAGYTSKPGTRECAPFANLGLACGVGVCDDSQQCCDAPNQDFCAPSQNECCGSESCTPGVDQCCRGRVPGQGDQCIGVFEQCCPGAQNGACSEFSYCCTVGGGASTCCGYDQACCSRNGLPVCSNEPDCWGVE